MKAWLLAALVSWILCWLARPLLRRAGIIDHPNGRSSHAEPTIRGGGVGMIGSWVMLGLLVLPALSHTLILDGLLGLAVLLAVVSFWDDVRSLSAWLRFAVQALVAIGCIILLGLDWPDAAGWLKLIFLAGCFLWLTGYTNAFNFMDGINGLATLQAVVTGIGTAGVAWAAGASLTEPSVWLALVISGSAAGFLPHNFPRARMFMGDVSSAPLGFLLAALALWIARDHGWRLLLPLGLLHANFVLDTGLTLCRRIIRGDRWHEPHREHFYQRLVCTGWSHGRVTLLQMGLQAGVMGIAICVVGRSPPLAMGALVTVIGLWLGFFAMADAVFRRHRQS